MPLLKPRIVLPILLAIALIAGLTIFDVGHFNNDNATKLELYAYDGTLEPGLPLETFQDASEFWLIGEIIQPANLSNDDLALIAEISGSFKLLFNGMLVSTNGMLDSLNQELTPGRYRSVHQIPKDIIGSTNEVRFLVVKPSLNSSKLSIGTISLRSNHAIHEQTTLVGMIMGFLAGIFFVAGLYYLIIYGTGFKENVYLYFGALLLCLFLLVGLEYLPLFYLYPYPFQFIRLPVISVLSVAIYYLLPLYLVERFEAVPKIRPRYFLLLVPILWLVFPSPDYLVLAVAGISLLASLYLTIWALRKKVDGSVEAFFGVLSCVMGLALYSFSIFLGFALLVIYNLQSLSIYFKGQRSLYEQSKFLNSRLESELLRRNIQPHFLMNTLMSVTSWMNIEPDKGAKMIRLLGEEFRIMNEIANKDLISIETEISLCRGHLEIMELRKGGKYLFKLVDIDYTEKVPPALFHTMIENGLTHSENQLDTAFELKFERKANEKIYSLKVRGNSASEELPKIREGLGFRYIRDRIQSVYGKLGEFSFQRNKEGFVNIFTIQT